MSLIQPSRFLALAIVAVTASPLLSIQTSNGEDAWTESILLGNSVAQLMVPEPSTDQQLRVARKRTEATARRVQEKSQEPRTKQNDNFRLSLRARWLQLNLEYQAFLAAPNSKRMEYAIAARDQYRKLNDYLWYLDIKTDGNAGDNVTLSSCGENQQQWNDAARFMEVVYNGIRSSLPLEIPDAKTVVRETYFQQVSPSDNSFAGINVKIQQAVGRTSESIQELGKEAVAAKVQAAVVMRRFYSSWPQAARKKFNEQDKDQATIKYVLLKKDEAKLFPSAGDTWINVTKLIGTVATGDPSPGVVENYLTLNLAIDAVRRDTKLTPGQIVPTSEAAAGNESREPIGYDGLVGHFNSSNLPRDIRSTGLTYPVEQTTDKQTSTGIDPELANSLQEIDKVYGGVAGPGLQQSDESAGAIQSMAQWMEKLNCQLYKPSGLAKKISSPTESLDSLLNYRQPKPNSHVKVDASIPYPAVESVKRDWFERFRNQTNDSSLLKFEIATSDESVEYLRAQIDDTSVPSLRLLEIELSNNAYSSQSDLLIRSMASTNIVAGQTSFSPESIEAKTQKNAGADATPVETPNRYIDKIAELLLSQVTKPVSVSSETTSVPSDRYMLEEIIELWGIYLPQTKTAQTSKAAVANAVKVSLKKALEKTRAKEIANKVPVYIPKEIQSDDLNDSRKQQQ